MKVGRDIESISTYLGDGVTARWNGVDVTLTTPRENGEHSIVLGLTEMKNLQDFIDAIHRMEQREGNDHETSK